MKRILLSIVFLLMLCAPAWATQVTLSSFQLSNYRLPGATATIRVYVSQGYLTSDGTWIPASPVGGQTFYKVINCTIASNVITVPSTVFDSTDDGRPSSARMTFILYDARGTKRDTLYSNYRIPIAYGGTMTIAQLVTWNTTAPAPPRPGFPDTQQVNTLINQVLPVADASDVIKGKAKLSVAPVSATSPIAVGDNDRRLLNSFNVKGAPYNAVGDGVADDTAAIQAAITAAISSTKGATVYLPPGTFKITTTLAITGVRGIRFVGSGNQTTLLWGGNASLPMITLGSVANSTIADFAVSASLATPLAEAFRIENAGVAIAPMFNRFQNIWIEGTNGGVGIGFRGKVGAGGNANNDFMLFENCHVLNYSHSGWTIEGNQSHGWKMVNCHAVAANGLGKYAVSGGGTSGTAANFFWDGGFVGHNTEADFYLGAWAANDLVGEIANLSSEASNRFLQAGPLFARNRATVRNVRWASTGLNVDGIAIDLHTEGPFIIENSSFGHNNNSVKIFWESVSIGPQPYLELRSVTIEGTETTLAGVFPGRVPTYMSASQLQLNQITTLTLNNVALPGEHEASGKFHTLSELITIAAAATTDTTIQLPAGAIVMSVAVRVTTAIPTAATFTVTGAGSGTTFNTAAVGAGVNNINAGTAAGAYYNTSAQTIRITPDLTPAANTGRVRVVVIYYLSTPPVR